MKRAVGLEYEEHGVGDAVLCIHGAIFSDAFAAMMLEPTLAEYRLIAYRRRGYGASEPTSEPPTIEEHARDALALLTHLDARPAHVIGHSGGGPIAVQLALDAPDAVRSLTLLEPALQNAAMAAAFDEYVAPLVEMHRAGESAKAMHVWMVAATGDSGWRDQADRVSPGAADRAIDDAGGTFDGDLVAMRSWDFDAASASRISQPVRYALAACNEAHFEPVRSMFCAQVPHTEVVVLPDVDHSFQFTQPAPVAAMIAEFLEKQR